METLSKIKIQNEIEKALISKGGKILSKSLYSTYIIYRSRKVRISDHASLDKNIEVFGKASIELFVNKVASSENAIKLIEKKINALERFENWSEILFDGADVHEAYIDCFIKEFGGSFTKWLAKRPELALVNLVNKYL